MLTKSGVDPTIPLVQDHSYPIVQCVCMHGRYVNVSIVIVRRTIGQGAILVITDALQTLHCRFSLAHRNILEQWHYAN